MKKLRLQAKQFIWCSYWGTWSRVLSYDNGYYVEVNLTPINPHHNYEWNALFDRGVVIRKHCTARDRADEEVGELPSHVYENMVSHWGKEHVDRLLTEDFLRQIDWDMYQKHNNGGASFDKIKKV